MKVLRVIVVVFLLLAATVGSAAASDRTAGFIRLVSHWEPGLPAEMQTRQALQLLMPAILDAQARGQIIQYEASLQTGVLKVLYHASAGPLNLMGATVYARLADSIAASTPAPAAMPAPELGAQCVPNFQIVLFDSSFDGFCLAPNGRLQANLRSPTGLELAVFDGFADSGGQVTRAAFDWLGLSTDINPGDTLTFWDYDGATLVGKFSVKVPGLSFTSANNAASMVQGKGPAGKSVRVGWTHYSQDALGTITSLEKTKTIPSTGTWSVDFGSIPMHGSDNLSAELLFNANFTFGRFMELPAFNCTLGRNLCTLSGFAFTPASVQIVHRGVTYNFSGTFDSMGNFQARLRNAAGVRIPLAPGDKVSGTGVAQYALPKLTLAVDYTADTLSGKAPPSRYVTVLLTDLSVSFPYEHYVLSSAAGAYNANFSSDIDLVPGMVYLAGVLYTVPSTGNQTNLVIGIGP